MTRNKEDVRRMRADTVDDALRDACATARRRAPEELSPDAERAQRLDMLKARIREGTYRPDIKDIAHHLVSMLEPTII